MAVDKPTAVVVPPAAFILSLVVLLLGRDRSLVESWHRTALRQAPLEWGSGLADISLGSLAVLVVLRLLQWWVVFECRQFRSTHLASPSGTLPMLETLFCLSVRSDASLTCPAV